MSWWEFWKSKAGKADFVGEFLAKNEEKIPGIRSIDQLEFVVLDTETSGFDPIKDHVLSFGAIKIKNRQIKVAESLEIFPESSLEIKQSVKIHGILGNEERVPLETFSKNLLHFLGNSILVGHHLRFDLTMLVQILKPFGLEQFPNPILDTMAFCMRLDHGPLADFSQIKNEDYSLDVLCKRFGIELEDRHTAAGDAFLTAQLFQKLLISAEKKGIRTFKELV